MASFHSWAVLLPKYWAIVSIRVKKLSNTNLVASKHTDREKASLPVDVRGSKTSLLPTVVAFSLLNLPRMLRLLRPLVCRISLVQVYSVFATFAFKNSVIVFIRSEVSDEKKESEVKSCSLFRF